MNQPNDESEIDENGVEWWTVNYRDAPADIVPQEQVDPEAQRRIMADLARRHANGERFYFTPNEQIAVDADGRPTAYRLPSNTEIIAFAPKFQRHDNEDDQL